MATLTYGNSGMIPPETPDDGQGVRDPFMDAMNQALRNLAPADRIMSNETVDQAKLERPQNFMAPSGPVFATSSSSSPSSSSSMGDSFKILQSQLEAINKETDVSKKQQLMIGVESAAGSILTDKAKQARILAEKQLGLETLREQLKQNEELDRNDPKWEQFQSDSKITSAVRQRLAQTEGQVDTHAQRILKEDGELARFIKTVDGTLSLQRSLIQKEEVKNLNKEQKLAAQAESLSNLLASIPTDVRTSFTKMNPNLKDDATFGAYVMQAAKGGKDRDNFDALMSGAVTPENYLQAGLSGNTIALQLAAAEQADRTGLPRETINKQLQSAYNFVNNPQTFVETSQKLGLMNAKQAKAYVSKLSLATDKEAKQALAQERLAFVEPYMALLQKDAIDSNVLNWSVGVGETALHQAPGAKAVIEELQAAGRPLTVNEFSKTYLSQPNLTPTEVAQRNEILGDAYARALERANRGIYGKGIDVAGATNKILVQNTLNKLNPGLAYRAGQVAAQTADAALQYQNPLQRAMLGGVQETGRTLRQVYEGFIGEQ